MRPVSNLEDFPLMCRVLEGSREALDELLSRGVIPAACTLTLAVKWLERCGFSLKDAGALGPGAPFDLLASLLADDARLLRAAPDGVALPDWLRYVAIELAREHLMVEASAEDAPEGEDQAVLPLLVGGESTLAPRQRVVLALLSDGVGAPGLALLMHVDLHDAASIAYEARRARLGAGPDELESPCGVAARALGAYLDSALGRPDRDNIRAHAAKCPACTRRLRSLKSATALAGRRVHASGPCPPTGALCAYARQKVGAHAREELDLHLASCRRCRQALVFDGVYVPTAAPVHVGLPAEALAEGRRRVVEAARPIPSVGFGVNEDACRVLYTSGRRGHDLFWTERRLILCEGATLEAQGIEVQVKCLPEATPSSPADPPGRCSIGVVFRGLPERIPVFLELEGEGEKQVTLREGAADFRYVRYGCHTLRFGRFKAITVALDVRTHESTFDDLLELSDLLMRRAAEAAGTAQEIAVFYRVADMVLRAAAARPGDPQALLRLLRVYLARPVPRVDPARLAAGRARAADRAAFVRFLAGGPVRALTWIRSASSGRELPEALRPLASVLVAWEARDRLRMLEALSALRAAALPDDPETDRFAKSLAEWLSEPGREEVREDLVMRLGVKFVDGLLDRFGGSSTG